MKEPSRLPLPPRAPRPVRVHPRTGKPLIDLNRAPSVMEEKHKPGQ